MTDKQWKGDHKYDVVWTGQDTSRTLFEGGVENPPPAKGAKPPVTSQRNEKKGGN